MAGEQFLLSGDQLATYADWTVDTASGQPELQVTGVSPLGTGAERFFLIRTQGTGDQVTNGNLFSIHAAVDDGTGTLVPDLATPLYQTSAQPYAHGGLGAGEDYAALGLYGGDRILLKLDGVGGTGSFTGSGDGELSLDELAAANPDLVVCFASGTQITTMKGDKPVEELRVGDRILTYEHGPRTVRWIGSTEVHLSDLNRDLAPVIIEPEAMGRGHPDARVVVSPAHRIFWSGPMAELLFEHPEVLIPASFLVNGTTIRRGSAMKKVTYWHFMCDRHEIVFSSGLKSESFHPGTYGMSALPKACRRELLTLFPEVRDFASAESPMTARRPLRYFEYEVLRDALGGRMRG